MISFTDTSRMFLSMFILRRYKAALQAGLQTVPVIISEMTEEQTAEVTLSENIQRKNLSVIEAFLLH